MDRAGGQRKDLMRRVRRVRRSRKTQKQNAKVFQVVAPVFWKLRIDRPSAFAPRVNTHRVFVQGDVDDLHGEVLPTGFQPHALDHREPTSAEGIKHVVLHERVALLAPRAEYFRAGFRERGPGEGPARTRIGFRGGSSFVAILRR